MQADGELQPAAPSGAAPLGAPFDSRLAIVQEISLALNSTLDPGKLLEVILDSSIRYTGATTGSVMLEADGYLRIVASRGLGVSVGDEVRLKLGEGITGRVAQTGEAISVPDVTADDRYVMLKKHIRSELAVPMVLEGRVVGVISVDSTRENNFSDDAIQLLSIVGTQAAQILENAEAYASLARRARRDETVVEVGQALGSALNLEELFDNLLEILSRRRQMTRGVLALIQPKSNQLSIEVAYGMRPEEIAKGRYQSGEGIIGKVFRTGKAYGIQDIANEPDFLGRTGAFQSPEGPLSFFAIPIFLEGDVVGVLGAGKVFSGQSDFDDDMALLNIVASTLSQAVKIHRSVAAQKEELLQENELLREELGTRYKFDNIVGSSPAMQEVFSLVSHVAPSRSTVLIRGESGTGKELIAHAIHFNSPRAKEPFVRVNCAAIPENLLEAELFGHVKGSFTGAIADRKGRFALADKGTIFLDEVGDMSPVLQAKILRILQERELQRVGSEETVTVDVRVIAATHRPLEELIAAGEFRQDLYYRLNVVPFRVPPLRERLEDIKVLARHFLEKLCRENGLPQLTFSPEALRRLLRYQWPGNVRELENVIERAVVLCDDDVIDLAQLPDLLQDAPGSSGALVVGTPGAAPPVASSLELAVDAYLDGSYGEAPVSGDLWNGTLRRVERTLVSRAMGRAKGVQLQAAELLGIHRNTLRKKLVELSLAAQRFDG